MSKFYDIFQQTLKIILKSLFQLTRINIGMVAKVKYEKLLSKRVWKDSKLGSLRCLQGFKVKFTSLFTRILMIIFFVLSVKPVHWMRIYRSIRESYVGSILLFSLPNDHVLFCKLDFVGFLTEKPNFETF